MLLPIIVYTIFASTIIVNKMLLQILPATLFIGIRMLVGGVILFLMTYQRSTKLSWSHFRSDAFLIISIALFTSFIPALLKAYGLKNLLIAKTMLIGSFDQCMTAIYAYLLLNERLTFKKIMGIGIVFFGIFLSCMAHSPLENMKDVFFVFSYPELAILGYVVVSRFGWTLIGKTLKKDQYSSRELTCMTMMISGLLASGLAFLNGDYHVTMVNEVSWCTTGALLVYTILAGNVAGYTLYGLMLKRHSANFVTLSGFISPMFVATLAWLILGEPISLSLCLSAIIISLGLYVFYNQETA